METFFSKNKVFITGLIFATCTAIAGFTSEAKIDWLLIGYSAFMAAGSYVVNNARGQVITIIGSLLTSASVIYTAVKTGVPLNVSQLVLTIAVNIGLAATGPIKPATYETNATIVAAKETPPVEQTEKVEPGIGPTP